MREDLATYSQALLSAPLDSGALSQIFEIVSEGDHDIAVHEFISIARRLHLDDQLTARLRLVELFNDLTYPHIPELAPFISLFATVFRPELREEFDVPRSITDRHLQALLNEGTALLGLEPSCIMAKASDQLGARLSDDEGRLVQRETPQHYGPCNCVSGETSYENFLGSHEMFAPIPGGFEEGALRNVSKGVWSTAESPTTADAIVSIENLDYFTFSTSQEAGEATIFDTFTLEMGIYETSVTLRMRTDASGEARDEWHERWDEYADLFQALADHSRWMQQQNGSSSRNPERYLYKWDFEELEAISRGEFRTKNIISIWDPASGGFEEIECETAEDAFQMLKAAIRGS